MLMLPGDTFPHIDRGGPARALTGWLRVASAPDICISTHGWLHPRVPTKIGHSGALKTLWSATKFWMAKPCGVEVSNWGLAFFYWSVKVPDSREGSFEPTSWLTQLPFGDGSSGASGTVR